MIPLQLNPHEPLHPPEPSSKKRILPLLPVELWQQIFFYLTYNHPLKHVITFGQVSKETRELCILCNKLFHCHLRRGDAVAKNIDSRCVMERKIDPLESHPFQRNVLKFYASDNQNSIYLSTGQRNNANLDIIRKCDKHLSTNHLSKGVEIVTVNIFKSLIENKNKISYLIDNTTSTYSNDDLGIFPEDPTHIANELIKEWVKNIVACHPIEGGVIVVTNFGFGFWKYLDNQLHLDAFFCLYKQCSEYPSGFHSIVYPMISYSVFHRDCLIISDVHWSLERTSLMKNSVSWMITTIHILPWLKNKAVPSIIDNQSFHYATALKKTGRFLYQEKGQQVIDTLLSFKVERQNAVWRARKLNDQQIKQFATILHQPSNWKERQQEFHIKRSWICTDNGLVNSVEIVHLPSQTRLTKLFDPFLEKYKSNLLHLFLDSVDNRTTIYALVSSQQDIAMHELPLRDLCIT